MPSTFTQEVTAGRRFEFGRNWARFLRSLDAERIAQARGSLQIMLGVDSLAGKTFLDVGSGSGLFSLAARQLGARVRSFDYDPHSVACTRELRERFFKDDPGWLIEEGSVLDKVYLQSLGKYDSVYSWGVLHHTGALWQALENVSNLVADGGVLFIAIYNDQGWRSHYWRFIKRQYNTGSLKRAAIIAMHIPYFYLLAGTMQILKGKWRRKRGMSRWHDLNDWLGGYPFEIAKPEEVFHFYRDRGFQLLELSTCAGGLGCNQYVFRKP